MNDNMKDNVDYVVPQHIEIVENGEYGYNVTCTWRCPNCKRRHGATKRAVAHCSHLTVLYRYPRCSTEERPYSVRVSFPWSDRTPRDQAFVYQMRLPGFLYRATGNVDKFFGSNFKEEHSD
jgi:hypothetical protein